MRRLILPLLTTAIYLFLSYLLVVVRPIQGSLRNILIIALVASYVFGTRWLLKDAYPIIPQKVPSTNKNRLANCDYITIHNNDSISFLNILLKGPEKLLFPRPL